MSVELPQYLETICRSEKFDRLSYQHKMKSTNFPFVYSFATITGYLILDFSLLHKLDQNGLVDLVI